MRRGGSVVLYDVLVCHFQGKSTLIITLRTDHLYFRGGGGFGQYKRSLARKIK